MTRLALTVILSFCCPSIALAGPTSKAAQEVAELLFKKGSKEVVEHGVQAFARKVETVALKHGDDVFHAVKAVGPKALPLIETHGARAAKILGKHGEHGVWIVSRPRALNLVAKHGEDAVGVLVKHPGVAEELVERVGHSAIHAFSAIGPQSGRRLAMLAEGEASHLATNPKLLDVVARFGDTGMSFVWKHKAALAVSAVLASFLLDPEPYISGAKELSTVVAETTLKPLAEVPGKAIESVAHDAMPQVARKTNWSVVIPFGITALCGLIAWLVLHKRRLKLLPSNG